MKMSKQLGWMIGLGLLSFTLVGLGTASTPHDAQAAPGDALVCRSAAPPQVANVADLTTRGVGTGGAAGAGPPLNSVAEARPFSVAAAAPKTPSSTALVFLPLWARQ